MYYHDIVLTFVQMCKYNSVLPIDCNSYAVKNVSTI